LKKSVYGESKLNDLKGIFSVIHHFYQEPYLNNHLPKRTLADYFLFSLHFNHNSTLIFAIYLLKLNFGEPFKTTDYILLENFRINQ